MGCFGEDASEVGDCLGGFAEGGGEEVQDVWVWVRGLGGRGHRGWRGLVWFALRSGSKGGG